MDGGAAAELFGPIVSEALSPNKEATRYTRNIGKFVKVLLVITLIGLMLGALAYTIENATRLIDAWNEFTSRFPLDPWFYKCTGTDLGQC